MWLVAKTFLELRMSTSNIDLFQLNLDKKKLYHNEIYDFILLLCIYINVVCC